MFICTLVHVSSWHDSLPSGAGPRVRVRVYQLRLPSELPDSSLPAGQAAESTEQSCPPVLPTEPTHGHGSPGGRRLQAAGSS